MALGYDMIYAAGLLATSPYWLYRLARGGKRREDWPARLGRVVGYRPTPPGQKTLLIHAVSVGEVNAAAGLVRHIAAVRPDVRLVVSVTTDTGIARAKSLLEPKHTVVRYPLDLGPSVRRFLDVVRPDAVGLIELEVWPNFIAECVRRRISVGVVNGRLSPRSFRHYRLARPLVKPTFSRLSLAAVQTQAYADRFAALGVRADRLTVTDSLKWDGTPIVSFADVPGADLLAEAIGLNSARPVIVAGSTAPGEEKLLLETCPTEAQIIFAPRRPERFDEVAQLAPMVRRSHYPDGTHRPIDDNRLFLLDTMGELNKAYALADVAIVGRSFLGMFGSNPIEPIALGKPTIIGPHYGNFADMVDALDAAGGIVITPQPGQVAGELLVDEQRARRIAAAGLDVIRSRQGVTARQADLLLRLVDGGD